MRQQLSKMLCLLLCYKVKTIDVLVRHFQLMKKHTHTQTTGKTQRSHPRLTLIAQCYNRATLIGQDWCYLND